VAYEEVSVLCRGDSGCGGEVPILRGVSNGRAQAQGEVVLCDVGGGDCLVVCRAVSTAVGVVSSSLQDKHEGHRDSHRHCRDGRAVLYLGAALHDAVGAV